MREGPSKEVAGGTADPGSDLVEAIRAAHDALVAAPVRRLVSAGFDDVTPAILSAMLAIPAEGVGIAELRRARGRAGRSKQAASQLLSELRRRGYVELRASALDGRAKVVLPTERGRSLRECGLEAVTALAAAAAEVMGRDAPRVARLLLTLVGRVADRGT